MPAQSSFSEVLAPLAARLRESHTTVRLVSQIAFEMRGDYAFRRAIREVVAWMKNRSSSIPQAAFEGEPFRIAGGGAHPAEAVMVSRDGGQLWAAVLDHPDGLIARRTWVTEISVGERGGAVAFGARLLNVTRGEDAPFESSRPGVARQLLSEHIVVADGRRLREAPDFVESEDDVENFIGLLTDPRRRLPVLAIARTATGIEAVEPDRLARLVSGTAHICVLDEEASWKLTREFGKSLSVFMGAARLYNPGLFPSSSDPFDHPLWLVRDINDRESAKNRLIQISSRIFTQSVRSPSASEAFPRFEDIRQIAAAQGRLAARKQAATDGELLELFQQDNDALRAEISRQKSENEEAIGLTNQLLARIMRDGEELGDDCGKKCAIHVANRCSIELQCASALRHSRHERRYAASV